MIYNVFHILFPEQNITSKEQIDEKVTELEFKASNSKEYKIEVIWNSAIYANKREYHLLDLYYLVA